MFGVSVGHADGCKCSDNDTSNCLSFLADCYKTKYSSITSDVELSCRFYSRHRCVAQFAQLLIQKPSPGQYEKGKGGNSNLVKNEKACKKQFNTCHANKFLWCAS